jgi:DNA-binding XRE family transcriptional regulator
MINFVEVISKECKFSPCKYGNIVVGHACYCHHNKGPRKCPVWHRHAGKFENWSVKECSLFESDFGANIKYFRKKLKMTQSELSLKVGISRVYLARIETNRQYPALKTLMDIADCLKIKIIFTSNY